MARKPLDQYTLAELKATFNQLSLSVKLRELDDKEFAAIMKFAKDHNLLVSAIKVGTQGPKPPGPPVRKKP